MSSLRPARDDEVARIWPLVRSARLAGTADELARIRECAPWRLQTGPAGQVVMLERWRAHLEVCAVQGLWAPAHEIASLVGEVAATARSQGFSELLSPLVTVDRLGAYLEAGMTVREPIVALQAPAGLVERPAPRPGVRIRPAVPSDVEELAAIDADSFDEFWRYGDPELAAVLAGERVSVATGPWGELLGYSTCVVRAGSATLGRLAVRRSARRSGVGALLLGEAAEWAERVGAVTFSLCTQESNSAARSLYAAAGLHEIDEHFALASMRVVD